MQAITDSLGNYRLGDVPAGAYLLGFYHALLDSIGIEPPVVRISIDGTSGRTPHRVDLGVPSAAGIITAVCGSRSDRKDSSGVVVGHLYDAASRQAVSGGTVVAEWQRVAVVNKRIEVSTPQLIATTTSSGGFAFCGAPRDDDITLTAVRGRDTTGSVTLHVPAAGFAHQQLYVDNVGLAPQRRLVGTVVDAGSHRPVAGAQVTIAGTELSALTNDRGAFGISGAPGGSRAILVRAVGYAPERRTVEILSDQPASVDVGLTSLKTMLDTMRITARPLYSQDATGFDQRRKSGFGRFFDSTDVAHLHPFEATRLLEEVGGVRLSGSGAKLRVFMGTSRLCEPAIFVDGVSLPDFTGADLNAMVAPEEISGMEVYVSAGSAPVQYKSVRSSGNAGPCGSILVWTKRAR
jgi:hypothetical protein